MALSRYWAPGWPFAKSAACPGLVISGCCGSLRRPRMPWVSFGSNSIIIMCSGPRPRFEAQGGFDTGAFFLDHRDLKLDAVFLRQVFCRERFRRGVRSFALVTVSDMPSGFGFWVRTRFD